MLKTDLPSDTTCQSRLQKKIKANKPDIVSIKQKEQKCIEDHMAWSNHLKGTPQLWLWKQYSNIQTCNVRIPRLITIMMHDIHTVILDRKGGSYLPLSFVIALQRSFTFIIGIIFLLLSN